MTVAAVATSKRHRARVKSSVPGRLRVRMNAGDARPERLDEIRSRLGDEAGVHAVETNATTGSVTVHYDPDERSLSDVLHMFEDVGIVIGTVEAGADVLPVGTSRASKKIMSAFDDFDRRLAHLTGHRIDLKLLFPLSMGVLGIRQLIVEGLGLEEIPAYVLLWYAFDSFYKLHREHSEVETTVVQHKDKAPERDRVHTETRQT